MTGRGGAAAATRIVRGLATLPGVSDVAKALGSPRRRPTPRAATRPAEYPRGAPRRGRDPTFDPPEMARRLDGRLARRRPRRRAGREPRPVHQLLVGHLRLQRRGQNGQKLQRRDRRGNQPPFRRHALLRGAGVVRNASSKCRRHIRGSTSERRSRRRPWSRGGPSGRGTRSANRRNRAPRRCRLPWATTRTGPRRARKPARGTDLGGPADDPRGSRGGAASARRTI